jgi:NAD(P)H dehydrogenase (quinone)
MSDHAARLLVTAASGKLGRLVVDHLLGLVPASRIVATVRNADAGRDLAARGVEVRIADHARPETLVAAFAGIGRLLLISGNAMGQRVVQHRNVIDAAASAGVRLLAYTSILHCDASPLSLAADHRKTEAMLRASGLPYVLLRNGWYTENYMGFIPPALAHGVLIGCAGDGLIASAARADYAAGAAVVLGTEADWGGRVMELAGDHAYTLTALANEIAQQSGKPVVYANMPEAAHRERLLAGGLPAPLAAMVAECDAGVAKGALFDDGGQLGALIGRPTTPMAASVSVALAKT